MKSARQVRPKAKPSRPSGSSATTAANVTVSYNGALTLGTVNVAGPLTVTAAARDALDSLRRDPLVLTTLGTTGLLALMATVAAGVTVNAP